jgi:hypothetical protein
LALHPKIIIIIIMLLKASKWVEAFTTNKVVFQRHFWFKTNLAHKLLRWLKDESSTDILVQSSEFRRPVQASVGLVSTFVPVWYWY